MAKEKETPAVPAAQAAPAATEEVKTEVEKQNNAANDYSWAQNKIKLNRAVNALNVKVRIGVIKSYTNEDVKNEYRSYHGIVVEDREAFEQEQKARARKIGYKG